MPGYLADTYRSLQLHDDVQVLLPGATDHICVESESIEVTQEWDPCGCYADMSIDFTYEEDVISKLCCDNLEFKDCAYYDNNCLLAGSNIIRRAGESERGALQAGAQDGDCYVIVADAGSDPQWSSQINNIACWDATNLQWIYTTPSDGDYVCTVQEGKLMFEAIFWLEWGAVIPFASTPNTISVFVLYLGEVCTFVDLRYRENLIPTPGPWISFTTWPDTIDELPATIFYSRTIVITGLNPITEYQISARIFNQNCKEINVGNIALFTTA